jgi:hypothetical protein
MRTGNGGEPPGVQLRREPFEFGLLPASYLLPRVETAAALVPIQRRLLAAVRPGRYCSPPGADSSLVQLNCS